MRKYSWAPEMKNRKVDISPGCDEAGTGSPGICWSRRSAVRRGEGSRHTSRIRRILKEQKIPGRTDVWTRSPADKRPRRRSC